MRKWTEEDRRKQSELIKKIKPWEKSTGPTSEEGKGISKNNAIRHPSIPKHLRDFMWAEIRKNEKLAKRKPKKKKVIEIRFMDTISINLDNPEERKIIKNPEVRYIEID